MPGAHRACDTDCKSFYHFYLSCDVLFHACSAVFPLVSADRCCLKQTRQSAGLQASVTFDSGGGWVGSDLLCFPVFVFYPPQLTRFPLDKFRSHRPAKCVWVQNKGIFCAVSTFCWRYSASGSNKGQEMAGEDVRPSMTLCVVINF